MINDWSHFKDDSFTGCEVYSINATRGRQRTRVGFGFDDMQKKNEVATGHYAISDCLVLAWPFISISWYL